VDLKALARTHAAVARRRALSARIGGLSALVCAGSPPPRNYPANPYEFRAGSHFLYFTALPLPGAALLIDGEAATLYLDPRPEDDELWHGRVPSWASIGAAAGCEVNDKSELAAAIAKRKEKIATVPAIDLGTRQWQERLLGRSIAQPSEADERLFDAIIEIRLRHDEDALEEMRSAADATAAAHRAGMKASKPGMRESHVRAAMEAEALARGMSMAYSPIVTVHGEVLHNHAYHHALEPGDMVLADVGAESRGGWASDVTRAWPVSGRFSSTQRAMYEIVLAGQREAIAMVRPGVRYRDIHLAASRKMTEGLIGAGVLRGDPDELVHDGVHALLFPHGVGHLLGLDVHDMEDLGDRAGYAPGRTRSAQFGLSYLRLDRDLSPGMAVTIEPGIYRVPAILEDPKLRALAGDRLDRAALDRFADVRGIRIEDDVVVTEGEPEVLTRAIPKSIEEVEATVLAGR
jgi:Xaa-Pro aminopeptidase